MITNIVLASTPLYEHITRYVPLIAPFTCILAHAAQAMGVLLLRELPQQLCVYHYIYSFADLDQRARRIVWSDLSVGERAEWS